MEGTHRKFEQPVESRSSPAEAPEIDRVLALSDGVAAYQEVASGQLQGRLVLAP